jgi:outer membrane protein TolC
MPPFPDLVRAPRLAAWVLALVPLAACAAPRAGPAAGGDAGSLSAPHGAAPAAGDGTGRAPSDDPLPGAQDAVALWVAWAEAHNPGLGAARARWQAALEAVRQEGALPDPRLRIGYMLEHVETRTGPMRGQFGLEQPFPWFGTLDAAERRAHERAAEAAEDLEATRLLLGERVRTALHELAWLEHAVAVAEAHAALVSQWEQAARSRYAAGSASQADVLRAQVELGKLQDRARTLADLHGPLVARLNAALGRPAGAHVDPPARPWPAPVAVDETALRDGLPDTSPALRARARRVAAAEAGIELSEKAFWPDLAVGLEYTSIGRADAPVDGSGDDALALTLGIELPVWRGRYAAGERRARAERSAAAAERADARRLLEAELAMTLYGLRDADRRLALYRDGLVPKGRQALAALAAAYAVGDASLLELVDAERELIEFELSAARAEADRANALVRAETLSGVTLHEQEVSP